MNHLQSALPGSFRFIVASDSKDNHIEKDDECEDNEDYEFEVAYEVTVKEFSMNYCTKKYQ